MTTERHDARCDDCGGRNPVWFVDSDRWNAATGPTGDRQRILCPGCFVARHEQATGLLTVWQLTPSVPFTHADPDPPADPTP